MIYTIYLNFDDDKKELIDKKIEEIKNEINPTYIGISETDFEYIELSNSKTIGSSMYIGVDKHRYPDLVGIVAKHFVKDEDKSFDDFITNVEDELTLYGITFDASSIKNKEPRDSFYF